jgi:peptide/nickel transport system substrate-binding protein
LRWPGLRLTPRFNGPGPWLLSAALGGLGCAAPATRETLVVVQPVGPTTLVPHLISEEFASSVLGNVYEPVVAFDADLRVVPCLADSWHNDDELTWVFRLRPDLRLHDGRPLHAREIAASLERARSDPLSRLKAHLAMVQSIEAPDARTLRIRTEQPTDGLLPRLAGLPIAVPATAAGPVGSGPYRVSSWSEGGSTVLEAFPDYRDGPPRLTRVEFRVVPDADSRARALREGRAQLAVDLPAEQMDPIGRQRGLRALSRLGMRVLFLFMDCERETTPYAGPGRNPFRDPRVRQAIARAIDRRALVDGPLSGFAQVVDRLVSPEEMGGAPASGPRGRPDPEGAARRLAEAGWPHGFQVTLDYIPSKFRAMEAVVASISRDLARIGVRVQPRPLEPQQAYARLPGRDTSFHLVGWISDTGEASLTYATVLHTRERGFGTFNNAGYSNPELDRVIEQALGRNPPARQHALLARAAEIVAADVPLIPLYRQADLWGVVEGLHFTPRLDRRVVAAELSWK